MNYKIVNLYTEQLNISSFKNIVDEENIESLAKFNTSLIPLKEENLYSNFGVDSFDENNTSTNQAIKSGKKDDDAKASHKFSLNNIPEGSVIPETQEFIIEKNTKINNQSSGFKISKFTNTEKEILNVYKFILLPSF